MVLEIPDLDCSQVSSQDAPRDGQDGFGTYVMVAEAPQGTSAYAVWRQLAFGTKVFKHLTCGDRDDT